MTDEAEARARVQAHLGSDDFELREFTEGWRVVRRLPESYRGAATFAVERSTGALLEFASGIPPLRVEEAFEDVRSDARVVGEPAD